MAIDPICGMTVDEKTAKFTSEYKEKNYYFCAPGCKKKFDADLKIRVTAEKKNGHTLPCDSPDLSRFSYFPCF